MVEDVGKKQLKNIVLITLITLSIWQTGKLWLGNMSSLSFFVPSSEKVLKQIEPESIWLVPGAPGTLVYRLGEGNREYESVRDEVDENIKTHLKAGKVREIKELNWAEMFEKKGILYQYPMPITYGEMIGDHIDSLPKGKSDVKDIDYIFIQLADDYRGLAQWKLISTKQNKSIAVDIQGQFGNIRAFNDLLSGEALAHKVKYQPTFNMAGFSKQDIFLPISSKEIPIVYDVLEWYNPLENVDDLSRFNPYINHYFLNPLLKKEEKTNDVYIFSELMEAVVKYYPNGVFEYSNIGAVKNNEPVSRLEAYNISQRFLDKNESMTKEIKSLLFLSAVEETKTGYQFNYDMRVGGIPIYFSKKEREALGMDHMAQITVEGREVSTFRWNANELRSKNKTSFFNMKYTEGINQVLEHVASKQELRTLVIDDMQWVYMIDGAGKDVEVRWIVLHDQEWYSP